MWLCYGLQQIKQVQPCTFSSCSGKALDLAPRYRICGGAFDLRGLCFRSGWLDFAILRNLSGVACHRNHFGRHGERTRKVGREGRCRNDILHLTLWWPVKQVCYKDLWVATLRISLIFTHWRNLVGAKKVILSRKKLISWGEAGG